MMIIHKMSYFIHKIKKLKKVIDKLYIFYFKIKH